MFVLMRGLFWNMIRVIYYIYIIYIQWWPEVAHAVP